MEAIRKEIFQVCNASETAQRKEVQNATEIAHCTGKVLRKSVLQQCRVQDRAGEKHVFSTSQNQTRVIVGVGCIG